MDGLGVNNNTSTFADWTILTAPPPDQSQDASGVNQAGQAPQAGGADKIAQGWTVVKDSPSMFFDDDFVAIDHGTFVGDNKFQGKNLLAEMPKEPPKEYDLDMTTSKGSRDTLFRTCASFRDKYVCRSQIDANLQKCAKMCAEKIATMPEGSAERAKLEKELAELTTLAEKTIADREKVVRFLPTEKRDVKTNLTPTKADVDAVTKKDMREAKVALRNLQYDLKRTHGGYSKAGKFFATLKQNFTTTRNSLFRWIQNKSTQISLNKLEKKGMTETKLLTLSKDVNQKVTSAEIRQADASYSEFAAKFNDFVKELGETKAEPLPSTDHTTDEALGDIKLMQRALVAKTGGTTDFQHFTEKELTSQIGQMGPNSVKYFAFAFKAGVALPVPLADVSVCAKYQYTFRVSTDASGAYSIDRLHQGGVEAKVALGDENVAEAGFKGGVEAGKGQTDKLPTGADAVRSLMNGNLGPLYMFCIEGKTAMVKSILNLSKLTKSENVFSDGKFLAQAQARNLLSKTDTFDFKSPNPAFLGKRTYVRIDGSVGGKVQAGSDAAVGAGGEFTLKVEGDKNAVETEYTSHYLHLRRDAPGTAGKDYLASAENGQDGLFDDSKKIGDLLRREPKTDAEKAALAKDIHDEVKAMLARNNEISLGILRDGGVSADELVASCRQGMVALAALGEKVDSLGGTFAKDTKPAFDAMHEALIRPRGMKLSDEQLQNGLYVSVTRNDDRIVTSFSLRAEANFGSAIADAINENVDSPWGKAAVNTAVGSLGGELGLKASAEVDVRIEVPKGDNKRPFRQETSATIDIRLGKNLAGKAIVALVQNACRKAAMQSKGTLKEQSLDAKGLVKLLLPKTLSGAAKNFIGVATADPDAMTEEEAEAKLVEMTSSKGSQDVISLRIDGNRITSVNIGSGKTSSTDVSVHAGILKAGASTERKSTMIRDAIYATPSFNAMTSICDDVRRNFTQTDFTLFAAKNKAAFARLGRIAGGAVPSGDKNAAKDLAQIDEADRKMMDFISSQTDAKKAIALNEKRQAFLSARNALQSNFRLPEGERPMSEERVVAMTADMMNAITQFYVQLDMVG